MATSLASPAGRWAGEAGSTSKALGRRSVSSSAAGAACLPGLAPRPGLPLTSGPPATPLPASPVGPPTNRGPRKNHERPQVCRIREGEEVRPSPHPSRLPRPRDPAAEDRTIRLAKRRGKAAGDGENKADKETRKPRSGRPVTGRALQAAVKGEQLSGPTKQRILRAVNHLLEQKKQDKIDLRALF